MSGDREELRELIEQLPDEQVSALLAEVRGRVRPVVVADWPPAWFGSFADERTDLSTNYDDLLADGFGR
jgi:hypothetical protein